MRSGNLLILLACLCAQFAFGQAQISSGDIVGTVVDETAALIPGVTATASDAERGTTRELSGRDRT